MGAYLERLVEAPVVVENDVKLAVLGEHWRGAAQGHDTCVFISLGVGIGAGILIGGELHRGHHSLAGEIAVMCMASEYLARDFGTRGCLETLVGFDTILRRWQPEASGDLKDLARALLRAAQAGEESARRAIGDAATLIGMAAANLSLVIDPSLLVLSGPLVRERRRRAGAGAQRRLPDHPPAPEGRLLGPGRWGDALREPPGGDSGGPGTPARAASRPARPGRSERPRRRPTRRRSPPPPDVHEAQGGPSRERARSGSGLRPSGRAGSRTGSCCARPRDTPAALERRWAGLGVDKPNVVLITLDTTRADHLGCYGYPDADDPEPRRARARGASSSPTPPRSRR